MYAYLIVEIDGAKLFINDAKINPDVMDYLKNAGIEVRPYESILSEVERCSPFSTSLFEFHFPLPYGLLYQKLYKRIWSPLR